MEKLYIFQDENGDLGYTPKASKYLIITLLVSKNPVELERHVRRVKKTCIKKKDKSRAELKFSKASPTVKRRTLEELSKAKIDIYTIILNKRNVYERLKENQNEVYNYVTRLLFENVRYPLGLRNMSIVVDKRASGIIKKGFDTYLGLEIQKNFSNKLKRPGTPKISIEHDSSDSNLCLQAVDMISGAIFRKYERKNNTWYSIISPLITKEIHLFFDKK